MIKLLRMELRKIRISSLIIEMALINIILIIIFIFLGYLFDKSYINTSSRDLLIEVTFLIYSAVLISRIIIDEYKSKMVYMLFLYQIDKKKLLISKVIVVVLMTFLATTISKLFIYYSLNIIEAELAKILSLPYSFFKYNNYQLFSLETISWSISGIIPIYIAVKRKTISNTVLVAAVIGIILCGIYFGMGFNILVKLLIFFDIIALISLIFALKEIKTHSFEADIYNIRFR